MKGNKLDKINCLLTGDISKEDIQSFLKDVKQTGTVLPHSDRELFQACEEAFNELRNQRLMYNSIAKNTYKLATLLSERLKAEYGH